VLAADGSTEVAQEDRRQRGVRVKRREGQLSIAIALDDELRKQTPDFQHAPNIRALRVERLA
jgi:hypothetical protein